MTDIRVDIDPDGDTLIILPPNQTFGSQNNIKIHRRYFRVSKKQLLIASPRAEAAMQCPIQEGIRQVDGLCQWSLSPIFDPEAFNIVMSILHARFSKVPDKASLEMLSNIALVVQYLRCEKSVHHFGKLWLTELDKDIDPDEDVEYDGITCARNLFVSDVFGLKGRLEWACKMAIFWSPNIDSEYELPINTYIQYFLRRNRSCMLENAAKELQAIMNQVMSDRTLCFLCRSAAVGAFMANFHINDFSLKDMSTRPKKLSWRTVCKTVRSFEYPSWAACGAGAKTHINLKEMVSRCLNKLENAPYDLLIAYLGVYDERR